MNVVKVKNVSKHFTLLHEKKRTIYDHLFNRKKDSNALYALRNISFSLQKGECLGVIGKNGSGKSTLLKIIAGIIRPSSGSVFVKGKVVPLIELGIGFQPNFTGRENIYLYGSVLGIPKKEIDEKFKQIVKISELENFIDTQIKRYSSGMEVRLAFSTAIVCNPDILLIDEVFGVGDLSFQRKSILKMKEFKTIGKSIIFVSHTMEDILSICDRCILLDEGKIIKSGNAKEVVNYYSQLIFREDKKKLMDKIDSINHQILDLESKKSKIKDSALILQIDATILKLEQEYSYSVRELKSLLSDALDNIQKQIKIFEIQQNEIEKILLSSDGKRIIENKQLLQRDYNRVNNKLKRLKNQKVPLVKELKDIIYSQIENNRCDKLILCNELKKLFRVNLEKADRRSIEIIEKIKAVVCKELKKNLSHEIKQKFVEEFYWIMQKEMRSAENINKKIKLIREYKEFINN